jgi:cytidine deaminase
MPVRKKANSSVSEATIGMMIRAAKDAARRAYCPYSKFHVGAVILASDVKIYTGCNVENASYGLATCAERAAVCKVVSERVSQRQICIVAVIVYTPTRTKIPCGACRQLLNEFGPSARIVSVCNSGDRLDTTLNKLLPDAFGPKNLS